jgi:hypothetical protein
LKLDPCHWHIASTWVNTNGKSLLWWAGIHSINSVVLWVHCTMGIIRTLLSGFKRYGVNLCNLAVVCLGYTIIVWW